MLEKWLASLPDHVREIMIMAGETVEKFDGDIKMATTLASLAFKRAVDSEAGRLDLKPQDQVELLKVAGALIKTSAKLKEQRLDVMDKYDDISDIPKPANMDYLVVTVSPRIQIKRLLLVKMDDEAAAVARQHDIDIEEVRQMIKDEGIE